MERSNFKHQCLFGAFLLTQTAPVSFANETVWPEGPAEVLHDAGTAIMFHPDFVDVRNQSENPYRFYIDYGGLLTYKPGDGDFGMLFFKRDLQDFDLKVTLHTEGGPLKAANSGIFIGMQDIRQPLHFFHTTEKWPPDWQDTALNKSRAWLGTWSGYEVQLLAGEEHYQRPWNERNGVFYGIEQPEENCLSFCKDSQEAVDFRFDPGRTYEVVLKVRGNSASVYMRWKNQGHYMLVSRLSAKNRDRISGHIGFQSYWTDYFNYYRRFYFSKILLREVDAGE